MEVLSIIYLVYMFISLYFLSFYFIIYLNNRKFLHDSPELKKHFSITVLIPAWNEEEVIESTIRAVFNIDYDNLREVIVVNDGSKDDTVKIVKRLQKEFPRLKLLDKDNSGKADSLNQALRLVKTELVAIVDSDSFPRKDSFKKMIGFFEDSCVGATTCPILARNKKKFFEQLQAIEYAVIALTRKLLERVDAIYVTPGPLAIYRKKALEDIGGFDTKNLTEDIEVTWHLTSKGWQRKMCLDTNVTTVVPNKFRAWFKQRQRWSMGGLQTMFKYKRFFLREGMIGYFILPFFMVSAFSGLIGISIFLYLALSRIIKQYFLVKFSFVANTAILTLNEFYFTPSVLNYLGIVLFLMGTLFTVGVLVLMREDVKGKKNIFRILFYMTVYLIIYPFIMITAIFKLIKRDMSW